jgi:catechol 2,3-dioxygenase-like lactoylglutathione lyase family enzyme
MLINALDHLLLTIKDIQASCAFYANILGMQINTFADNHTVLHFGQMEINFH